jgi:hypothetical protein
MWNLFHDAMPIVEPEYEDDFWYNNLVFKFIN